MDVQEALRALSNKLRQVLSAVSYQVTPDALGPFRVRPWRTAPLSMHVAGMAGAGCLCCHASHQRSTAMHASAALQTRTVPMAFQQPLVRPADCAEQPCNANAACMPLDAP